MSARAGKDQQEWPSLVREVRSLIWRENLFPPGAKTLIMISGGQDSVALLELLAGKFLGRARPTSIHALHVNHHLRGEESDADQALVARHCSRLSVELTISDRPITKAAGNVQAAAREARREAALAAARELGCERIALGHTADDQVENMLYRLGRYGGLAAIRGMLPCNPPWVRPLLNVRRKDTASFCLETGLEYAVDRGNAYPGYARTGIREQVLPAWERVLPGAVRAASRAAEVAAEMEQLVDAVLAEGFPGPDSSSVSAARLLGFTRPVRRLLLHALLEGREGLEVTRTAVLALERLMAVPGSAGLDLGGGWRAHKEYDLIRLEREEREAVDMFTRAPEFAPEEVSLSVPGEVQWRGVSVRAERVEVFSAPDPSREAYVDGIVVSGKGLTVRSVAPGDRIQPLGMSGTRKVQDILVDLRVPAAARRRVPMIVSEDGILWLCGLVVAEQGRITRNTREFVRFSLEPAGGSEGPDS